MSKAPDAFQHLLAAWNERDEATMRQHLEQAITPDITFVDPTTSIRGIDAFVAMIKHLQARFPDVVTSRTSGIDRHHDRARYSWRVVLNASQVVDGFDAAALDETGRVRRIDGFFGPLPPM